MKELIDAFFEAYGMGILMLVLGGLVVAGLLELTLKNGFSWMETKVGDNAKAKNLLVVLRYFSILVGSVALTECVTEGVIEQWGLPSLGFTRFIWWGFCYIAQYIFSMFGIKGLVALFKKLGENAEARATAKAIAKAEAEANKTKLTPVAGTKGLYVTEDGQYVNAKGQPV